MMSLSWRRLVGLFTASGLASAQACVFRHVLLSRATGIIEARTLASSAGGARDGKASRGKERDSRRATEDNNNDSDSTTTASTAGGGVMDETKRRSTLRALSRGFILQVHPDRLGGHSKEAGANQTSLMELNAFLDTADQRCAEKAGDASTSRSTLSSQKQFLFHFFVPMKSDDAQSQEKRFHEVRYTVVIPPVLLGPDADRMRWRQFADDTVIELLERAEMDVPAELRSRPRTEQVLSGRRGGKTNVSSPQMVLGDPLFSSMRSILGFMVSKESRRLEEQSKGSGSAASQDSQLHLPAPIDPELLFFDRSLDAQIRDIFVARLSSWLLIGANAESARAVGKQGGQNVALARALMGIPILVCDEFNVNNPPGFLCVPYDCNVHRFTEFVMQNAALARRTLRSDADARLELIETSKSVAKRLGLAAIELPPQPVFHETSQMLERLKDAVLEGGALSKLWRAGYSFHGVRLIIGPPAHMYAAINTNDGDAAPGDAAVDERSLALYGGCHVDEAGESFVVPCDTGAQQLADFFRDNAERLPEMRRASTRRARTDLLRNRVFTRLGIDIDTRRAQSADEAASFIEKVAHSTERLQQMDVEWDGAVVVCAEGYGAVRAEENDQLVVFAKPEFDLQAVSEALERTHSAEATPDTAPLATHEQAQMEHDVQRMVQSIKDKARRGEM